MWDGNNENRQARDGARDGINSQHTTFSKLKSRVPHRPPLVLQNHPPQRAIQAGFDRALLTITDANVTTFFVAIILLSIGSGPVRGFAVTLAVGIVTSMFTAILVTRALVNLMFGGRKLESLKI